MMSLSMAVSSRCMASLSTYRLTGRFLIAVTLHAYMQPIPTLHRLRNYHRYTVKLRITPKYPLEQNPDFSEKKIEPSSNRTPTTKYYSTYRWVFIEPAKATGSIIFSIILVRLSVFRHKLISESAPGIFFKLMKLGGQ